MAFPIPEDPPVIKTTFFINTVLIQRLNYRSELTTFDCFYYLLINVTINKLTRQIDS
ncbi:MAG: Uncharacterised protein [Flavobacteriaceae bacterium]|nr:MAG: Uncharacterised protein [Flavobacteriaceae bacterium]